MRNLRVREGGTETPKILLLHGLGATGEVWNGLTDLLDRTAWTAPDLPGHGGSEQLPRYTFAAAAEAVAGLVDPRGTVILGHSFGGVIGLHLAGRAGVRAVADPSLDSAVTRAGDGWRPAFDPRAFAVGEPGIAGLLAAAPVPVVLARGEHDPMVSGAQLAALVPDPVELPGLGHNAHVENPAAVLALVNPYLAG